MEFTPLKMQPCYKDYLWGGGRLKAEYGKKDAPDITAESWELTANAGGMSVVAAGELQGKTLMELGQLDHDGFWGKDCPKERFPVMVKLIDSREDLSVQVHPSDDTALAELGQQGKAEMWYVVDCHPKATIHLGFSRKVTPEEFRKRAENGTICQVLNRVRISKGDVFYIVPGTIHAIGKGTIIAEIQQNSNTTFRVYDFCRKDAAGQERELHIDQAQRVLNYQPIIPEECKANNVGIFPGFTVTEMYSCEYFRAFRVDVTEEVAFRCDGATFHHLLCVGGSGEIIHNGISYPFRRGGSYFLPAKLGEYKIVGNCKMLFTKI